MDLLPRTAYRTPHTARGTPRRRAARRLLVCTTALISLASIPGTAAAQECFRGRPLPDCRAFWITEVGVGLGTRRDSSSEGGAASGHLLTWELGYMRNVGERNAVGGTVFIEGDGSRMAAVRAGVKGRYRIWLEGGRSVDVGPGVILLWEEPSTPSHPSGTITAGYDLGGVLSIGYNIGDLVSLTGQVEAVQSPSKTLRTAAYVGVRLGSYPGAIAAFLAIVAAAVSIPTATSGF